MLDNFFGGTITPPALPTQPPLHIDWARLGYASVVG